MESYEHEANPPRQHRPDRPYYQDEQGEQTAELRQRNYLDPEGQDYRKRPAKPPLLDFGIFKTISRIVPPIAFIVAIILFCIVFLSAAIRADLWIQLVHLLGVFLIILAVTYCNILACYYLLDPFLSFREFNNAIKRWEQGLAGPEDGRFVQAMATRSGLVFLAINILEGLIFLYLDFQ